MWGGRAQVLLKRREEGYLALEGVRREHERLVDAIKMQQYQDAFFGRQHRKVTSLVDGGVLESVGLRKTMAWEDPWDAERGVGPWVVRIALGELVYAIEERAVVECGDALTRVKAEYEQQHELAIELRSANEDDLTEARVEREAADRARTALEGARAKLEATQAEVEGLEARYEGLWRAMEETLEQAEELARATERANADRGASRVSADVLALAAEDMEAGVPEAHAAEGARRAALVAEEAALPAMRAALAARRGAREEAEARVAGAERGIGVRGAEAEFQAARRAREEARRDRAAGEARRCAHALGELRRAAQEERALLAFASTVPEAARALADLRAHATAMQVEAYAREARAGAARGARGAADAAVADGLFEAAALRHRASLIAAEQAAERAASREAVARPAVRGGAAPPLHFARWARVFAPGPDGPATLVRAAPSARAVGVRGWVASPPARSGGGGGGGFTALGSRALDGGRHAWTVHLQEMQVLRPVCPTLPRAARRAAPSALTGGASGNGAGAGRGGTGRERERGQGGAPRGGGGKLGFGALRLSLALCGWLFGGGRASARGVLAGERRRVVGARVGRRHGARRGGARLRRRAAPRGRRRRRAARPPRGHPRLLAPRPPARRRDARRARTRRPRRLRHPRPHLHRHPRRLLHHVARRRARESASRFTESASTGHSPPPRGGAAGRRVSGPAPPRRSNGPRAWPLAPQSPPAPPPQNSARPRPRPRGRRHWQGGRVRRGAERSGRGCTTRRGAGGGA